MSIDSEKAAQAKPIRRRVKFLMVSQRTDPACLLLPFRPAPGDINSMK